MKEKRKARRIVLEFTLVVKRIDDGKDEEVTIDIHDVSKTGIGFLCAEDLEMDAVYESYITIWTKEVIHTLIKIVRKMKTETGYLYGAVFMGLSEIDAFRIAVYDTIEQELHNGQQEEEAAGDETAGFHDETAGFHEGAAGEPEADGSAGIME